MVKTAIVCSRPDVLLRIRSALSHAHDVCIVSELPDCRQTVKALSAMGPDVLLLNVGAHKNSDTRAIIRLLRSTDKRRPRAIAIIPSSELSNISRAIELGVSGVILEEAIKDSISECIRRVHAGQKWFDPVTTAAIMRELPFHLADGHTGIRGTGQTQLSPAEAKDMLTRAERAEQASLAKSRLVADMSHELRTLLNAIIGFSGLVLSETVGSVNEQQRELLQDNLHCSRELLELINDLLDLAKIEAGKMEVFPERIDPMTFIRTEVVDLLRGAAIPKRISIEIAASSSLREVVIDTRKFKKIVYNFVSNAIKFSPPNGRITIRMSEKREKEFMVEVLDEGPGIPQDKIKLLFNPFQQVGPRLDGQDAGTGLGLALCKEVAKLLGGRVGVSSIPGKRTAFYVTLPTHLEPTQARPKKSNSKVAARPKILIVEDEDTQRRTLCRILDQAGYRVEIACDLQQAIKKCQSTQYDAITLDLALGRENGLDLLNQIGQINQHTPVIVVSSSKGPLRFLQAHVHARLSKPVLADLLVESLSSAGVRPPNGAAPALKSPADAHGATSGESPYMTTEKSLIQC